MTQHPSQAGLPAFAATADGPAPAPRGTTVGDDPIRRFYDNLAQQRADEQEQRRRLEAENAELRRQLADVRRIAGHLDSLGGEHHVRVSDITDDLRWATTTSTCRACPTDCRECSRHVDCECYTHEDPGPPPTGPGSSPARVEAQESATEEAPTTSDGPGGAEADLYERLAAIEHERWADWQRYVHGLCYRHQDGLIIPAMQAARWERQINTPYADLTEAEKDSDREQVDRYWPLIAATRVGASDPGANTDGGSVATNDGAPEEAYGEALAAAIEVFNAITIGSVQWVPDGSLVEVVDVVWRMACERGDAAITIAEQRTRAAERLRAERDAYKGHSVTLFRIARALAEDKTVERYEGDPVALAERLIAERDQARAQVADLQQRLELWEPGTSRGGDSLTEVSDMPEPGRGQADQAETDTEASADA